MTSLFPHLRELLKKKCSLIMDFFQKGGGIRGNPKVLGHFLCTNNFGILGRKGRGWTKSKSFWAPFWKKSIIKLHFFLRSSLRNKLQTRKYICFPLASVEGFKSKNINNNLYGQNLL